MNVLRLGQRVRHKHAGWLGEVVRLDAPFLPKDSRKVVRVRWDGDDTELAQTHFYRDLERVP